MRKTKVQNRLAKIAAIQKEIEIIQSKCKHPTVSVTPRASTGGYDGPDYDSYWYEKTCAKCQKFWTEDQ